MAEIEPIRRKTPNIQSINKQGYVLETLTIVHGCNHS